MIRVFIADDHPIIRIGIRQALAISPEIEVIGEAADGNEILDASNQDEWDVLMLDLSLPGKNGWEVLRRLRVRLPDLRVIIISVHEEALYALQALKMGASGYLTKGCGPEIYSKAIHKVHSGDSYVSEDLISDLARMMGSKSSPGKEAYDLLTEREMQVFLLISGGKRVTDIAEELNISVKTVSTHRRHVLDKLNLKSNSELVRYAIKEGLLV